MVDLWLQSRHYNKEHPLMEVHGVDFVICDYKSFVEFKKTVDYQEDFQIVREVDLLILLDEDLQSYIHKTGHTHG